MASNPSDSNWLGLLRWSMQYSDGTTDSNVHAMNEDDKRWLEQVMKEAVRDDAQRMNEILCNIKEKKFDEIESELDELRDIVEQVDMAQVFAKYGGCDLLLKIIEENDTTAPIQASSASVIATVAQNNLQAQDLLLKNSIIDRLSREFLRSCSDIVTNKLLFALSCSIRGHPAAEEYFIAKFSDPVLSKALKSGLENVASRAVFLAVALLTSDYCSCARVKKLTSLFLPFCVETLAKADNVDLADNIYRLLLVLLQTEVGHETTRNTYHQAFHAAIASREERLSGSSEDSTAEQNTIRELRYFYQNFQETYPSSTAKENERKATDALSRGDNSANDGENEQSLLLIAPPPLEASSQAP